jgi:hypothetical protein
MITFKEFLKEFDEEALERIKANLKKKRIEKMKNGKPRYQAMSLDTIKPNGSQQVGNGVNTQKYWDELC